MEKPQTLGELKDLGFENEQAPCMKDEIIVEGHQILSSEKEQNKNCQANGIDQTPLISDLHSLQLSSCQHAQKMEINVSNMIYPMGDDVDDIQYKMVFLVRMDLKMGNGKIAAQTAHAVLGAYQQLEEVSENPETEKIIESWEECGCPKTVLIVDSKEQLLEIEKKAVDAGLNTYVVCDAGKTQVDPGSLTVCAIGPARADAIDAITMHLKLLS